MTDAPAPLPATPEDREEAPVDPTPSTPALYLPIPNAAQLRRRRRRGGARCRNCGAPTGGTGTGLGRCSACYRYQLRHGADHLARRTPDVLVAWQAGAISEGQAARLLGVDRLEVRRLRDEALARTEAVAAAEARERRAHGGPGAPTEGPP